MRCFQALEPLTEIDAQLPGFVGLDHVPVDTAARRVVDHHVAALADQFIDPGVHVRIAGRGVVAWSAGVQGGDASPLLDALGHLVGDLRRLRGQIGTLIFGGHPASGRHRDDDLAGCDLRCRRARHGLSLQRRSLITDISYESVLSQGRIRP